MESTRTNTELPQRMPLKTRENRPNQLWIQTTCQQTLQSSRPLRKTKKERNPREQYTQSIGRKDY